MTVGGNGNGQICAVDDASALLLWTVCPLRKALVEKECRFPSSSRLGHNLNSHKTSSTFVAPLILFLYIISMVSWFPNQAATEAKSLRST
jgi:hypothetical protein